MTKKAKTKVVTESVTLPPSQLAKISSVLSGSYGAKDHAAVVVTKDLCSQLKPLLPKEGQSINDAGVTTIMGLLREKRGWSADTTKSRKTEIKCILQASRGLYPAVTAFTEANAGICGWNSVVGLARKLSSGLSQAEAVKAQSKAGGKGGEAIKTREDAQKWVARKLKGIVNAECMTFMPRGFVKELQKFAIDNSLKV